MQLSLEEITSLCGGTLYGDGNKIITSVSSPRNASNDDLVFIKNGKFEKYIKTTNAGAVLIGNLPEEKISQNYIVVDDPQLAFAKIAQQFESPAIPKENISNLASISETAKIGENVYIGDFVSIGEGARVGNNVYIGQGSRIGESSQVGDGTVIFQNVVIGKGCRIGCGCRIHPGVVIGADGFGLVKDRDSWKRIPQLGNVQVGDQVDIGANTTIDRGTLDDTVISDGVKLDNLIQIGHNVRIGKNTVIAAHTAIAGSTVIGKNCEIGGCVGIMDHSLVGDEIKIGGGSVISGKLLQPGIYSSSIKAEELSIWQKNAAWLRRLYKLADRVKKLEEK
ncbi:MAG: UDP-3-O-(3-hydroxymyristoyl)glucosamine N-acyltransferase [Acidiferrobacterales bacterium]